MLNKEMLTRERHKSRMNQYDRPACQIIQGKTGYDTLL